MGSLILIVITLTLNNLTLFMLDSNAVVLNTVWDICMYGLLISYLSFIYKLSDVYDYKLRITTLLLIMMFINNTFLTVYDRFDIDLYFYQYPIALIFFLLGFISVLTNWELSGQSKIYTNQTYFVFKRPKNLLSYVLTFFINPAASFSILHKGDWFVYKKNLVGLRKISIDSMDKPNYCFYKVSGKIDSAVLNSLVGKKWTLCRNNCVTVFKPIFEQLNIKLGLFDFIPSVFRAKFLRSWKDGI